MVGQEVEHEERFGDEECLVSLPCQRCGRGGGIGGCFRERYDPVGMFSTWYGICFLRDAFCLVVFVPHGVGSILEKLPE